MPKRPRKKRPRKTRHTCEQCGKKFTPTSPHDIYCSTRCRLPGTSWNAKTLAETPEPRKDDR